MLLAPAQPSSQMNPGLGRGALCQLLLISGQLSLSFVSAPSFDNDAPHPRRPTPQHAGTLAFSDLSPIAISNGQNTNGSNLTLVS